MGLLMLPFGSKLAWLIKGTVRDGGIPARICFTEKGFNPDCGCCRWIKARKHHLENIEKRTEKGINSLRSETLASERRSRERELRWSSERIEKLMKQEDRGFWFPLI